MPAIRTGSMIETDAIPNGGAGPSNSNNLSSSRVSPYHTSQRTLSLPGSRPILPPKPAIVQSPWIRTKDIAYFFEITGDEQGNRVASTCRECRQLYEELYEKDPNDATLSTIKWQYSPGTSTTTLREHLHSHHSTVYRAAHAVHHWKPEYLKGEKDKDKTDVVMGGMGVGPTIGRQSRADDGEGFSRDGFEKRLANWVVASDQPMEVLENPEFRDLLLYLRESLVETDIPTPATIQRIIHQQQPNPNIEPDPTQGLSHPTLTRMSTTPTFSGEGDGSRTPTQTIESLQEIVHAQGQMIADLYAQIAALREQLGISS